MLNRSAVRLFAVYTALLPVLALGREEPLTAEAVRARHLEARGGEARLRALQSVQLSAVTFEGERVTPSTLTLSRPNRVRSELQQDGARTVQVFEGGGGWFSQAGAHPTRLDVARTAMMSEGAQFDEVLLDPAGRGVTVTLAGVEEVQGAPAWRLQLTHRDWTETRLIDQGSGLEVKRVFRATHGAQARTLSFSGFRKVRGFSVAAVTEWQAGEETGRSVLRSVRFNVPVDEEPLTVAARRR